MPGLRASRIPGGATYRAVAELSSGFVPRAVSIYPTLLYSTAGGGGRG